MRCTPCVHRARRAPSSAAAAARLSSDRLFSAVRRARVSAPPRARARAQPSRDDASGYADDGWSTVPDAAAKPKKKKTVSGAPSDEKSKTTVTVETRALHLVIGKGGATINKLKDATGVDINVSSSGPRGFGGCVRLRAAAAVVRAGHVACGGGGSRAGGDAAGHTHRVLHPGGACAACR